MERFCYSYFPTTALLLDDREAFLNGIALNLGDNVLNVLYSDPVKALEAIQGELQPSSFLYQALHGTSLGENFFGEEVFRGDRFKEISVAFVDYLMPPMDGLEFCRRIKDLPIRKVIMTGNVDLTPIKNAMEEGIVDEFILKSDAGFLQNIGAAIQKSHQQYFETLTEDLRKSSQLALGAWSEDPAFLEFFSQLLEKQEIVEYYVIDRDGQVLLFDRKGQPGLLVLFTDQSLQSFCDKLANCSSAASQEQMTSLLERKMMPISLHANDEEEMKQSVAKGLFPAHKLEGDEVYYYALVKDVPFDFLQSDNVITFNHYLMQLYA